MPVRAAILLLLFVASLAAQPDSLTLLYTGKLMGYARVPDIARMKLAGWLRNGKAEWCRAEQPCARPSPEAQRLYRAMDGGESSAAARAFAELLPRARQQAASPVLLLGMGDNFAVDYYARVVQAETDELIPKDELYYSGQLRAWVALRDFRSRSEFAPILKEQYAGTTAIPGDNVASFLRDQHYDALVPGKHDFYFGTERLRQLAQLLARDGGPQMLGANLILKSKVAREPVALDEAVRARRRNFETAVGSMKWVVPKTVLPWLREFRLKDYAPGGNALVDRSKPVTFCATEDRDVDPRCAQTLELKSSSADELVFAFPEKLRAVPIPSERTYQLCVPLLARADRPQQKPAFCRTLDVNSPLFQYPDDAAAGMAGNRMVKDDANARPLGVRPWVERHGAVVMGVVDPELASMVGGLNSSYLNRDEKTDTWVAAMDPAEALGQLLEFCRARGACREETTMILMAQMPYDEASILNDRMRRRFATVLSQADNRLGTTVEPVSYGEGHRPVVLVPPALVSGDGLVPQVSIAVLKGLRARRVALDSRALRMDALPAPQPVPGSPFAAKVAEAWKTAMRGAPDSAQKQDPAKMFRTVALHALRDHFHADVALMQERDFYHPEADRSRTAGQRLTGDRARLQAAVEQILWKGDFGITRTLTGAALKAALAESERARAANDAYVPPVEPGRQLVTLGLTQGEGGRTWYVNGSAVEDKATYVVAMSDFLAGGDTGYPSLKDPAVPPGPRSSEIPTLLRLSDAVLNRLDPGSQQAAGVPAYTYLDHTNHAAFVQPAAGLPDQVRSITRGRFAQSPNLAGEERWLGQVRSYWRLFLDKGEIGMTNYQHNQGNQQQLVDRFGGTSQSGVLARKSTTFPVAIQAEVRREGVRQHLFTRTELEYTRTTSQQDGREGRELTTYPSNKVSVEAGFRRAFEETMRSRPWNGWLVSLYGESNVHQPVLDGLKVAVKGPCQAGADGTACPDKLTFASPLPRTGRLLLKGGFRRENQQNWFEAGLFSGKVMRPVSFRLSQGGQVVGDAVCHISGLASETRSGTLSACVAERFSVPVASQALADGVAQRLRLAGASDWKNESGAFLNFNFRVALPRNALVKDFGLEQRGQWFLNHGGDSVLDALLVEKISLGPTITLTPRVPGLSLKPTYSLFFYRNKVVSDMLVGRTFDIKLEYRFDWHTGASWWQVLGYGRPR